MPGQSPPPPGSRPSQPRWERQGHPIPPPNAGPYVPPGQFGPPGQYGPGGTYPPGGSPGSPQPPVPMRRGRTIALIAAGVVVFVGLSVAGVLVARQGTDASGPSGPVLAEHCVDLRGEMPASSSPSSSSSLTISPTRRVACSAKNARGKVVKVLRSGERTAFQMPGATASPDCPDGADGVMRVTPDPEDRRYWEVCTRNLAGPHPGDPGMGGALLGAGDCIGDLRFLASEKPCSAAGWYGRLVARAADEGGCPASRTLETARLSRFGGGSAGPRPVLCIGAGGRVLSSGDCIGDVSFALNGPEKRGCASAASVAKVTGRVRARKECPPGSDKYLEAEGAYLPILCLHQIRPTLDEKIKSLGGS